jgi:hypothetical protein
VKIVTARVVTVGKAFAYFFVGFFSALVFIELTDGEPAKKVNYYTNNQYMVRYVYNPFPSGYYNHRMRPDTFNAQRPNNGGSSRSGGTTRTTPIVERGETHTGNVPQNDRKKN